MALLFRIAENENNPNAHQLIIEYIKCSISIKWSIIW